MENNLTKEVHWFNDGSLESGIVYVNLTNATFVQDIGLFNGTVMDNLPIGFTYTVTRESDTRLKYEIIGNSSAHSASNTVTGIRVRVDMDKVNGTHQYNFGSNNITIQFND